MTKKVSRMNRCATSRATLRELERKGVLGRERIGIRHIIRAGTGMIEPVGLSVDALHGSYRDDPTLTHLQAIWPGEAWVAFEGGRARLIGAQPHRWSKPDLQDLPPNNVATELMRQTTTKGSRFYSELDIVGDAVLVTDHREHCVLQPTSRDCTPEILDFFGSMLSTQHSILESWGRSYILFHEEPSELDIIAIKLRWS